MKIGWIGCGNMGRPMATNLIKGGYSVLVNDVSEDNVKELVTLGAQFCQTPKELAIKCDVIFTMVPNGKILQAVNLDEATGIVCGLTEGKIVVDMSTVAPEESVKIYEAITEAKCDFLRAPVTGSTTLAASASLGIFASGKKETFERLLPLFHLLGDNCHYLGDGEQARVLKLAINIMIAINMQMLAEAMVLIDKSGMNRAQAMDIICKSAVGSPVINYKKDLVVNNDYKAAFSVLMMEKDLDLALSAGKSYCAGLPLTAITRQFLAIAHSCGHEKEDFSYLVKQLEDVTNIK